MEDSVEVPLELEEFVNIMRDTFKSASTVCLEDLKALKPRESFIKPMLP